MSNRYEEVIRLVLDVESDKAEKKIAAAQDRANQRAVERAREVAGVAEARVGPRAGSRTPRQSSAGAGGSSSTGGVAGMYRALGHVAGSLMRGQMPAVSHVSQFLRSFSSGGGGGTVTPRNFSPATGRAAAATPSHAAAVRAGNTGTLGSGRPTGMPPTPPAPPRRTPPPIPPNAPRLSPGAGGGGFLNRGVSLFNRGLATIGGGGAAGAAGIAGLVLISLKHLASGIGKYTNAIGLWGKAFITGDASKALKGAVSYAQGIAHIFGPIMGALMSKIIGVYGKFIDALDGLVAALGKYNPIVNAQARVLEVQQKMFRIRMAAIFQPLMSAWLQLKSTVLELMGQLAPLLRPVVSVLTAIVKAATWFISQIKPLLVNIVSAFTWLFDALRGNVRSFGDVKADVQKTFDQRSLSNAAASFNKGVLQWARALGAWQQFESTRREKPLWKRVTSGDGSVIPGAGGASRFGSRRFSVKDTLLQEYLKGKMSDEDFKNLGGDLEAAKKARAEQARRRANWAGTPPVWRGGRSGDKLPDDPLRYVPASRRPMAKPGDSLPAAAKPRGDANAAAKLPLTPQVSFNQKIENKFQLSIANDAAVRESMNQVRDKMLRGLGAARDEANLVGSMLVASSLSM